MSTAVRIAALALAAVFGLAAAGKLADRRGTAATFAGLGLRRPGELALAVPVLELVTVVELLLMPLVGAVLALFQLVAFTVVLIGAIRSGVPVDCACFGAIARRDAPVGWGSVARNAALVMVTLVVLAGAPSPGTWAW